MIFYTCLQFMNTGLRLIVCVFSTECKIAFVWSDFWRWELNFLGNFSISCLPVIFIGKFWIFSFTKILLCYRRILQSLHQVVPNRVVIFWGEFNIKFFFLLFDDVKKYKTLLGGSACLYKGEGFPNFQESFQMFCRKNSQVSVENGISVAIKWPISTNFSSFKNFHNQKQKSESTQQQYSPVNPGLNITW